ncbi:homeobox protein CDX-1-like isoform X2 [Homalodisca vitripennis]|uniref:homeobox protein CDX-1-like isoform X2 n=1 Tax=Homalodisca vitripennis TaxID=197043 RepID=UPI001EEA0463|nr:homeobox protein CDX-1-like isoform X2 [Homalodisca vitripennis]
MVYYNPVMYGQHPGWYQSPQQQYLSCMMEAAEHQWPQHHPWPIKHEMSSGGSDFSSPSPAFSPVLPNIPGLSYTPTVPQSTPSPRPSFSQPPRQTQSPYSWLKEPSYKTQPNNPGKTRTKDKYRVVYTDHQRLELEKEFHYSRYITIRRKAELATNLGLSERQVKIWFQNRRAKERKQLKKREELLHKEKMQQLAML